MKRVRNLLIPPMALAAITLIMTGCRTHGTGKDAESSYDYTPPPIPAFVQSILDHADWETDTICAVDGKAFYRASDFHYRTNVIYDDKKIYLENPTLWCDSVSPEEKYKFNIFMVDKEMVVDFNNKESVEEMARLDTLPSTFLRLRKDTLTGYDNKVLFSLCVDFMRPGGKHAATVNTWLAQMAEEDASQERYDAEQNTSVTPKTVTNEKDMADLARRSAEGYFNVLRKEENLDTGYDIGFFFRDVCLRAWHVTDRFVTIMRYNHNYTGGAHGYYTESLITYDPETKRVIDWDFLFKPECNEKVLRLFYEKVPANTKYKKYCSVYVNRVFSEMFTLHDNDGNTEDKIVMPRPGLGEKGVVFSFQPYELSGYPDGTFHITIPYGELTPFLTDGAKRLLEM